MVISFTANTLKSVWAKDLSSAIKRPLEARQRSINYDIKPRGSVLASAWKFSHNLRSFSEVGGDDDDEICIRSRSDNSRVEETNLQSSDEGKVQLNSIGALWLYAIFPPRLWFIIVKLSCRTGFFWCFSLNWLKCVSASPRNDSSPVCPDATKKLASLTYEPSEQLEEFFYLVSPLVSAVHSSQHWF